MIWLADQITDAGDHLPSVTVHIELGTVMGPMPLLLMAGIAGREWQQNAAAWRSTHRQHIEDRVGGKTPFGYEKRNCATWLSDEERAKAHPRGFVKDETVAGDPKAYVHETGEWKCKPMARWRLVKRTYELSGQGTPPTSSPAG